MKKHTIVLFILCALAVLPGASVWEGAAAVSADFPESGLYVATNSFPRNTVVDLTNLETGQTIRVIVAAGLDTPGLLATVSAEAADAIGLRSRTIGRIRMIAPQDPIAFSRFSEDDFLSGDPDFDPVAAVEGVYGKGSISPAAPTHASGTAAEDTAAPGMPLRSEPGSYWEETPVTETLLETLEEIKEEVEIVEALLGENEDEVEIAEALLEELEAIKEEVEIAEALLEEFETTEDEAEIVEALLEELEVIKDEVEIAEALLEELEEMEDKAEIAEAFIGDIEGEPAIADIHPEIDIAVADNPEYSSEPLLPVEPVYTPPVTEPVYTPPAVTEPVYTPPAVSVSVTPPLALEPAEPPEYSYTLIPAEEKPPVYTEIITPHHVPEEPPVYVTTENVPQSTTVPPPQISYAAPGTVVPQNFSVPAVAELETGKYYLQLGAFSHIPAVEQELVKIGRNYPLTVQSIYVSGQAVYRVLIGPVNQGEAGALLKTFQARGYKDAFVRRG